MILPQANRQGEEADPAEREVDPEDPPPGRRRRRRRRRREGAPDERPAHGPDRPGQRLHPEPGAALAQRHQVRDQDLGQRDDPPAADALDGAPDQQGAHRAGGGTDDGAEGEEAERDEEDGFAAEQGGQGGQCRLEDGRGEEEGCAGPEGFDGAAVELARDDLGLALVFDGISGRGW